MKRRRYFIHKTLVCFFCFVAFFGLLILNVPKPMLLQRVRFSQAVYDQDHRLLRLTLTPDEKYRLYTPLKAISPILIEATLMQEDRYFYDHIGINPAAVVKAFWHTYVLGTRPYGASTITMQVARMLYGIRSKTIFGKLWQMVNALQLELFYTKDEILEAYLNLASYGGNVEGVGAASQIYFDRFASQLNLLEALSLVVVPQNPNKRKLVPGEDQPLQVARHRLFEHWLELHPEDASLAGLMELPLQLDKRHLPFRAPHFVDSLLRTGNQSTIVSTLDLTLQTSIEEVVHRYIEQKRDFGVHNTAAMLVDVRSMQVKVLIGSANFFDSAISGQVNGTRARRSPGSALKPFIFALALDQGLIHPHSILMDMPTSFGDYSPENFDRDFLGPVKAKDALILSRNIPSIDLLQRLSNPTLYQLLLQAEVKLKRQEKDYGLSLALGGGEVTMQELVGLYAMLANGGSWQALRFSQDQPLSEGRLLLSPEASFLTLDMLCDTPRPYAVNASIEGPISVFWKTGTSSSYRDGWAVGLFGPYVLAVWIGDFSGKGNPAYVGASAAAPLFFQIIEAVCGQQEVTDLVFPISEMNLCEVEVCEASGMLPTSACPDVIKTWFIPGKSPIETDDVYRKIAIDPVTGWRTQHLNEAADFVVYEFWPSDILQMFAQVGVRKRLLPTYSPDDSSIRSEGMPPRILSPQQDISYVVRGSSEDNMVYFSAAADADVRKLYWFVDCDFIGTCSRDSPLVWKAKPGVWTVRVVDDHGRSSAMRCTVVLSQVDQNRRIKFFPYRGSD